MTTPGRVSYRRTARRKAALAAVVPVSAAPPDGTFAIGVHVTLVDRWLDPAETEALITPFTVLYPPA